MSEHIVLRGFAGVKELVGDAGDSPIVQQKTQGSVGVGAAYHF
jgi:outer membrane scaffolding protein for murein synthesis (MipA/OmpV family)